MAGAIVNRVQQKRAVQAHEVKLSDAKEFVDIVNSMKDFLRKKMEYDQDGVNGQNGLICMLTETGIGDSFKKFIDEFEPFENEVNRSINNNSPIFY